MIEEKALVDSNILVYAYDNTSDKHEKAVETIEKYMLEEKIVLSIQNIVEFTRVVTEKIPKAIPKEQARNIILELSELSEIISYDSHVVADALLICKASRLHFFDALLSATMEKEGIKTIITENEKDFKKIAWINAINPFK